MHSVVRNCSNKLTSMSAVQNVYIHVYNIVFSAICKYN